MKPPSPDTPPRVRVAKAEFAEIVVVCRKCAKRQGLPKGALRTLLKAEMKRSRPGAKLRILETGCLGPCPKHRLAVVTGASAVARRILLIDPAAAPAETLAALLPPPAAGPSQPPEIGDGPAARS